MSELTYAAVAILAGFVGLVWSAHKFVDSSASMARSIGVPPLIIGLTIVSLGTSAPEILVSINAALSGAGELAIGNAIGSNIANIGMVLGATALIARLPVRKSLLVQEMPVLLGITLLSAWFLMDSYYSRLEGQILLALIVPVMLYLIFCKKFSGETIDPDIDEGSSKLTMKSASLWFVVGLATLIVSSKILVWGATETAVYFGVSPLIIGLSVVAVGTSLPEAAASIVSAVKGHYDLALGNVIGSNAFNLLAVMSIPAIVAPMELVPEVFSRDFMVMFGLTLLLSVYMLISYCKHKDKSRAGIGRVFGLLLLVCYVGYYYMIFIL